MIVGGVTVTGAVTGTGSVFLDFDLLHMELMWLKSSWTEWSTTRSAGQRESMTSRSPWRFWTSSLRAARSIRAGIPVKS